MATNKDKNAYSKNGEVNPEWAIEEKPVKVNKWDAAAVKNGLDDAVRNLLVRRGYTENHGLMNGRLLICTIAVLFAGFALLWDYLNPFPESRPVLILCVLSYFVMMGVLTLYTTRKEKRIFCVAVEKDQTGVDPDNIFTCSSMMKRYDDMYTLTLEYTDGQSGNHRQASCNHSVTEFYDENGTLCSDIFDSIFYKLLDSLLTEKKVK